MAVTLGGRVQLWFGVVVIERHAMAQPRHLVAARHKRWLSGYVHSRYRSTLQIYLLGKVLVHCTLKGPTNLLQRELCINLLVHLIRLVRALPGKEVQGTLPTGQQSIK